MHYSEALRAANPYNPLNFGQTIEGNYHQAHDTLTNRETSHKLLHIQMQARPPNPLLQGLDCFPDTQMPSICTTVKLLEQLIPTTLPIWHTQLKATIAKHTIHQFQSMYIFNAKVGAIALGQSNKMLQLMGMLPSFVDTTKELGGHHEQIQACHQTSGRIYISPSHMQGNRIGRRLYLHNLAQFNPWSVSSCCRSCC